MRHTSGGNGSHSGNNSDVGSTNNSSVTPTEGSNNQRLKELVTSLNARIKIYETQLKDKDSDISELQEKLEIQEELIRSLEMELKHYQTTNSTVSPSIHQQASVGLKSDDLFCV